MIPPVLPDRYENAALPAVAEARHVNFPKLFRRNQVIIQRLSAILHLDVQIAEHFGHFRAQRVGVLLLGILTIVDGDERVAILNDMLDQLQRNIVDALADDLDAAVVNADDVAFLDLLILEHRIADGEGDLTGLHLLGGGGHGLAVLLHARLRVERDRPRRCPSRRSSSAER